jgi:hypothetical protein
MRRSLMLFMLGALTLMLALPALAGDGKQFRGSDCGPFTVTPIAPGVVLTEDTATGKANRGIGRYTLEASEVVNLATLEVTDGQFTLTARKGSISGTYEGTAAPTDDPAVITYHVEGPITGGTGRYAGVSGQIVFDGIATFNPDFASGQLCDEVTGVLLRPDDEDD